MSKGRKRKPFTKLLRNVKNSGSRARAMTKKRLGEYIKIEVNENDLEELWNKQSAKCFWLDITLKLDWLYEKWHPLAPSVDRLQETKGYVKDNIVISSRLANLGRLKYDTEKYKDVMKYVKGQINEI